MSIGKSGRIVIEVEPGLKKELYEALGKEGLSLKSWFLENAQCFLTEKGQISLSLIDVTSASNGVQDEI